MEIPNSVTILYPGEMGLAIGRLLSSRGIEIICFVAERSERTRQNALDGGFTIVGSFEEAVARANMVISLVTPQQAIKTARRYAAELIRTGPESSRYYCDANSVSPTTMSSISHVITSAGAVCIDGAIHGGADTLPSHGILLVSGQESETMAHLLGTSLDVRLVGPNLGTASAIKMCLGAFSKSLIAVFVEMMFAAGRIGATEELLTTFLDFYPEITPILERLLPSYPRHISRRVQEVKEAETWCSELGTAHGVIRGTRQTLTRLEQGGLDAGKDWMWIDLARRIAADKSLLS